MRQKCVFSIALLVIVVATGCAKKPDDAALVTNIKSQMFSDAQLKDSSLEVTSKNGEVTLAGNVSNDAARYEAYKIATQTPGVAKVNDQMTVQQAQNTPVPPADPAPSAAAPPPLATRSEDAPPLRKTHAKKEKEKKPIQTADNFSPQAPQQQYQPPADQPLPAAPPPQPAPAAAPPPPPPPPPPQPKQVTIPAGSTMTIRMIDGVNSEVNKAGEIFHASLDAPLVVDDQVVVPKGADVYVRLSDASSAGRLSGKSELHLELIKLEYQGRSYPLVSSTYSLAGSSRGKNTAEKVGGGAALGAIIGALAGGGKGAAIGAGVGAGAGGVYQGATKGKQVKIPSETKLDFQLDQPINVTVMPRSTSAQ
jgi:BON domain